MNIRSCTRYGIRDRIDVSGDSPGRDLRSAPFGRPVVPELSTIVRPVLPGGSTLDPSSPATSASSSASVMARTPSGSASRNPANSSSAITTSTDCSSTTATSCSTLIPVFISTRSAPALPHAASASIIPRWFRHSTATTFPRTCAASRSVRTSSSP